MIARLSSWKLLLCGVVSGAVLGLIARLWMRWISTNPEFSWSGTIFIIGAFTIFTTTQATVFALRRRTKSKRITSIIRGGGVLFSLPIFGAAGAIMFPTVALASIALWQKSLDKKFRIALSVISLVIPILQINGFISDFGMNIATFGRVLLFVAIYSVVICIIKPTITPYESLDSIVRTSNRRRNILVVVFIVLITLLFLFFTIGISGN